MHYALPVPAPPPAPSLPCTPLPSSPLPFHHFLHSLRTREPHSLCTKIEAPLYAGKAGMSTHLWHWEGLRAEADGERAGRRRHRAWAALGAPT